MKGERPLPRKVYAAVEVVSDGEQWGVRLDRARLKTPAGAPLRVPTAALAEIVADEWRRQGSHVDPATMPMTRLVNVALDRVAGRIEETRQEIVAYAGTDLVCYRAEGPPGLRARQAELWDPILGAVSAELGVIFATGFGIAHVKQEERVAAAVAAAVAPFVPLRLAALHSVTTLTGSAVLALAVARRFCTPEAAWEAANVDEDWQNREWGVDAEAAARRARRWLEMAAAGQLLLSN
ncbi:MAG: ATP12 family protein [Bauldia sp.]